MLIRFVPGVWLIVLFLGAGYFRCWAPARADGRLEVDPLLRVVRWVFLVGIGLASAFTLAAGTQWAYGALA